MNEQKPEELTELRYYQRALELQAEKIECQKLELARMNRVYTRDVENAKVWEVLKFLVKIIIKKIKK